MRFFATDGKVGNHRGAKDLKVSSAELLFVDRLGSPVFCNTEVVRNWTALFCMS